MLNLKHSRSVEKPGTFFPKQFVTFFFIEFLQYFASQLRLKDSCCDFCRVFPASNGFLKPGPDVRRQVILEKTLSPSTHFSSLILNKAYPEAPASLANRHHYLLVFADLMIS